jgi:acyl-CoA thioesterase I
MRILIFGDSIAQGFFDGQGGWAERLRRDYDRRALENLAEHDWDELFNLGVSGDTVASLINRLEPESIARRWHKNPQALVIAIGINDTMYTAHHKASNVEQFGDEVKKLLSIAGELSQHVLFVGMTPVNDAQCNPWQYSETGKSYRSARIWEFEQELRRVCAEQAVPCVEIFEAFTKESKNQELLADGLHPNDKGHELIYKLVAPELEKLLAKS